MHRVLFHDRPRAVGLGPIIDFYAHPSCARLSDMALSFTKIEQYVTYILYRITVAVNMDDTFLDIHDFSTPRCHEIPVLSLKPLGIGHGLVSMISNRSSIDRIGTKRYDIMFETGRHMSMEQTLSFVLVTPYTIAKSRTGGVIARLLSRVDLELVGAQMIAMDEPMAKRYADYVRTRKDFGNIKTSDLLADYALKALSPSGGRKHRTLFLLFRGIDPCTTLINTCGAIFPENRSVEMLNGETIRDTYADLITDPENPEKITYFEPAVMTPRNQHDADEGLSILGTWLDDEPNLVENIFYPNPSKIERTLVIIKPDNWRYSSAKPGSIMDMFSRTGLRIIGIKVHRMSVAEALEFYGPVRDALNEKLAPVFGRKAKEVLEDQLKVRLGSDSEKALINFVGAEFANDQFEQIIEFMSGQRPSTCPVEELSHPGSVKCMILIYEGESACQKIRDVLGPTDPLKAPGGTVRREFGSNIMVNTAHASDSVENAKREMKVLRTDKNACAEIIRSYISMRECAE